MANNGVTALIMVRGYKAAPLRRQGFGPNFAEWTMDLMRTPRQTARQSHSAILAITSPNKSSAADQIRADTKLAI